MLRSKICRRYSAPAPLRPETASGTEDPPVPKLPKPRRRDASPKHDTPAPDTSDAGMYEAKMKEEGSTYENLSRRACEAGSNREDPMKKVFGTSELLDLILANVDPRDVVRIRRTSKAFHNAVGNNSKIEQKLMRKSYRDANGNDFYVTGWGDKEMWEFSWDEIPASVTADPAELLPWHEILGHGWTPDDAILEPSHLCEFTVTAGRVFKSFFVDLRAMGEKPYNDCPLDIGPKLFDLLRSRPIESCFLYAHYLVRCTGDHLCSLHPRSGTNSYRQVHVSAQMDSTKPDGWIDVIRTIAHCGPAMLEALKFSDAHSTEHRKYLRQKKCFYDDPTDVLHPTNVASTLLADPLYTFVMD